MADKEKQIKIKKDEARPATFVERTRDRKTFVPAVDIYETNDDIVILADLPGATEKSVNITLEKDLLTLEASLEPEAHEGYNMVYSEFETGDYYRAFNLSEEINRDKIEAKMKNGVLRLSLPKAEPAKARKIEVKAE